MRFAKRRADWRLGRWTAKLAVSAYLNAPQNSCSLHDIEIRAASCGAPNAFVANEPADMTISLSHRNGTAMCAVTRSGIALGCDLELIEPRSAVFLADYFTAEEQALLARVSVADQPRLVTLLWSAKESTLKALHTGLRLDTRSVAVKLGALPEQDERERCLTAVAALFPPSFGLCSWTPLQVQYGDGIFHGWWQYSGNLVRTLVAAPPPHQPILLRNESGSAGALHVAGHDSVSVDLAGRSF